MENARQTIPDFTPDQVHALLRAYGNHRDECNTYQAWGSGPNPCDCGLGLLLGEPSAEPVGGHIRFDPDADPRLLLSKMGRRQEHKQTRRGLLRELTQASEDVPGGYR